MKTVVISLGGSIIVPDSPDEKFLKQFRNLIIRFIGKGYRFVIITGGGKTSRVYQKAARNVTKLHEEDIDWLGIHGTRLNAHLLRTIFRDYAHKTVIKDPRSKSRFKEKILLAGGWKPGRSTDYDAVLLARNLNLKTVINLTNIDHVYDKDPTKYKNAKPYKKITWQEFRNIVGDKWDPGMNAPFDPVASKLAQKLGLKVIIIKGTNLKNLENFLNNKNFVGTTIS